MAKEIERKFLLLKFDRKLLRKGIDTKQGYLCLKPEIRVRIAGQKGFFTVKSRGLMVRDEIECQIPVQDAKRLLSLCKYRIHKTRFKVGRMEIDIYYGQLRGLMIAEIELRYRSEKFRFPEGTVYKEVTNDRKFKNQQLAKRMKWRKGEKE